MAQYKFEDYDNDSPFWTPAEIEQLKSVQTNLPDAETIDETEFSKSSYNYTRQTTIKSLMHECDLHAAESITNNGVYSYKLGAAFWCYGCDKSPVYRGYIMALLAKNYRVRVKGGFFIVRGCK